ncbi:MAG: hypothetical protein IPN01_04370 [Deltaproteobacteria bacterium]|nr:hypothetical protein [Deltaproteobacteria bacterium]
MSQRRQPRPGAVAPKSTSAAAAGAKSRPRVSTPQAKPPARPAPAAKIKPGQRAAATARPKESPPSPESKA